MACSLARSVESASERDRQWLTRPASHPREARVEVYPRKKRWKRPLQDAAGAKGIPPTGFSVVRFSAALIKGPRIGLTLELASPAPVQFAPSQNKAVPTPCHPRGVPKVPAPQGFIIWASSLCLMTLVNRATSRFPLPGHSRMMKQILLRVATVCAEIIRNEFRHRFRGDFSPPDKISFAQDSFDPNINGECGDSLVGE